MSLTIGNFWAWRPYSEKKVYSNNQIHFFNSIFLQVENAYVILSDRVDQDSGGESGRQAWTGRDILSLGLSHLESRVLIHLHCPDPPRLTVLKKL